MATASSLGITFDTNAGNHTVVATPAVGDYIVIVVANTGRTTAQTPTISDNNTDGRGTYALISAATSTKNTSADSMWWYVRNALIGSATSTTFTAAQASDSGGGLQVFKVTGMSIVGIASVRAAGVQNNIASGSTPAPAFPQAALTANACLGAIFNATNPATMNVPTGWTESQDVGYNVPATGVETVFRSSGVTLTTITWGGVSGSAYCSAVIELDTSVPQYSSVVNLQAVPVSSNF